MTDLVTIGLIGGGKGGVELHGVGKRIVGLPILWVSNEGTVVSSEWKGVDVGMGDFSISEADVSVFLRLAMQMTTIMMMMMMIMIMAEMTMTVIMVVSKR